MGSITYCCASFDAPGGAGACERRGLAEAGVDLSERRTVPGGFRRISCLLLLAWVALLPGIAAHALDTEPVELRSAQVVPGNDAYLLNAFFALTPTDAVHSALANGVPLTMKLEVEIIEPRRWWWDRRVETLERRYVLRHHALTEQYVLRNLSTGRQQSYEELAQALEALGTIARLPISEEHSASSDKQYYARLRVQLDVEALPVPLRPRAYLQSAWAFSSDWHEVAFPAS